MYFITHYDRDHVAESVIKSSIIWCDHINRVKLVLYTCTVAFIV